MNPKLDFIFARRSLRAYTDAPVSEEIVRDLLEAAMAAPSAVCKDPWRFVVIRDRRTLGEIAGVLPNGKMLAGAAVGVAVCGDLGEAHDRQVSYLLQDTSAAIQNLLLAATALGLGACWLGVHPREDRVASLRRILALPPEIVPVSVVAMGWPAERKDRRTRYVESYVHRERW